MGATEDAALPPGWAWARLGDLITAIEAGLNVAAVGRAPDDGETGIVKISAVTWGEFDERQSKTLPSAMVIDPRHLISEGDFLISRANTLELVGAPVIVRKIKRRLVLSDKVLRLRFKHSLDRWVELYLKSGGGRAQIEGWAQGAQLSMRNISQENLRRIMVPVAPDPERRRILDVLNCSLSEVDEVDAAMKRARERMADYRASLLHAACTGALTADWRAANPHPEEDGPTLLRRILAGRRAAWESAELARLTDAGKVPRGESWKQRYPEPISVGSTDLPTLPSSWSWGTIDQLTHFKGNGLSRKPVSHETETPILRISAVRPLRVDRAQTRFYDPQRGEMLQSATAKPGDLLFTRYSGSEHFVGVCGMLRGAEPVLYPDKIMNARPVSLDVELGPFIEVMLAGDTSRQFITANIRTTAGQKGIAGSAVRACPVPIPPPSELKALVDAFFEALPAEEDAYSFASSASDAINDLHRSILHAAFSGRLVPQDPEDEPASSLLSRIRTETSSTPRRRSARAGARL